MKRYNSFLNSGLFLIILFSNCKDGGSETLGESVIPEPVLPKITVEIDKSTKYQTIEGFGFFGGADVWWSSPSAVWNDAWAEKAISDLGITIWRNELFPPSIPGASQDADWGKQKPVVQGLKAKADKYKVDLKFIARSGAHRPT
jgi:glucuronoarabinoxylan endo-1,4-beta-xylanase